MRIAHFLRVKFVLCFVHINFIHFFNLPGFIADLKSIVSLYFFFNLFFCLSKILNLSSGLASVKNHKKSETSKKGAILAYFPNVSSGLRSRDKVRALTTILLIYLQQMIDLIGIRYLVIC